MRRRAPGLVLRADVIGMISVLGSDGNLLDRSWTSGATDLRVRFAAQSMDAAEVALLLDEVEALYCAGPAGGCGVRRHLTPRVATASCLVERTFARPQVTMLGADA
jgi:hypothetical protein